MYFRITGPIKEWFEIPVIDLTKLFEKDESKKIEYVVNTPPLWYSNVQ